MQHHSRWSYGTGDLARHVDEGIDSSLGIMVTLTLIYLTAYEQSLELVLRCEKQLYIMHSRRFQKQLRLVRDLLRMSFKQANICTISASEVMESFGLQVISIFSNWDQADYCLTKRRNYSGGRHILCSRLLRFWNNRDSLEDLRTSVNIFDCYYSQQYIQKRDGKVVVLAAALHST